MTSQRADLKNGLETCCKTSKENSEYNRAVKRVAQVIKLIVSQNTNQKYILGKVSHKGTVNTKVIGKVTWTLSCTHRITHYVKPCFITMLHLVWQCCASMINYLSPFINCKHFLPLFAHFTVTRSHSDNPHISCLSLHAQIKSSLKMWFIASLGFFKQ